MNSLPSFPHSPLLSSPPFSSIWLTILAATLTSHHLTSHFVTSRGVILHTQTKLFTVSMLHYLQSVRIVQGAVRDFLACKRARMKVLDKIWDMYELRYVTVRYVTLLHSICYSAILFSSSLLTCLLFFYLFSFVWWSSRRELLAFRWLYTQSWSA